jgi:hypothetical protein
MTNNAPSRRGVALLITLAAIVISVVACASLARLAVTTALSRSIDSRSELATDLLHAAETPIQRWLREQAAHVVLPPDATAPAILVLDDVIGAESRTSRLTITAWDQRGMAPPSLLVRGMPTRSTVPSDMLAHIDDARKTHGEMLDRSPGLDLFETPESGFPAFAINEPTRFGEVTTGESSRIESRAALGAFIATHNPPPPQSNQRRSRRRNRPQAAINVNTAPIELIEAAMRMAGRRGIEQIVDARERGESARATGSVIAQPIPNAPALIATSDVWSFRIDATIGTLSRSWWAVYTKDQGSWRCVQRLAIDR